MSLRHIGVYFVVWACHLCYPDGAGFPGCSGSPREGPPVPGQNCKLSRPSVTLPNERRWNFPSRSLEARPSFPGRVGVLALQEAGYRSARHLVTALPVPLCPCCAVALEWGDINLTTEPSQSTQSLYASGH